MDTQTTTSPRRTGLVVALTGAAVVVALLVAGTIYVLSGSWYVEYECEKGEAPASSADQGNGCFEEGSDLPPGFTFDAGGNQRIN